MHISNGLLAASTAIVTVLVALVARGGGSAATRDLLIAICGLAALCAMVICRQQGEVSLNRLVVRPGFILPLVALPLVAVLQFVATHLLAGPSTAPIVAPPHELMWLIAAVLYLLVAMAAVHVPIWRQRTIVSLVALGVLETSYGVLNLLAGNEYLLFWPRLVHTDSATGTFVNRNDFACFLELTTPLALLLAAQTLRTAVNDSRARERAAENHAKRVVIAIGVAVMALGLLLSRSRMGLASLGLATILVVVLDRALRPLSQEASEKPVRVAVGTVAMAVGLALFLLAGVGLDVAIERFASAETDFQRSRLPIWKDSWALFLQNPILGSGFGSFELLLPTVRHEPTGLIYTHAHSEYLELLAENGLVGLAILVTILLGFGRRLVASLRAHLDPWRRLHVLATSIGILSILFHASVDYAFHVPAVGLTLLLVIALFLQASVPPPPLWRSRTRP